MPGDRLWVREAFYRYEDDTESCTYYKTLGDKDGFKWSSPVCMPRKYSRLTLEIVDVRCEQLKAISGADCDAEGCRNREVTGVARTFDVFIRTWDALNAKQGFSWDSNPWVFVITFKTVKGGVE
jgi:hypothetical protein